MRSIFYILLVLLLILGCESPPPLQVDDMGGDMAGDQIDDLVDMTQGDSSRMNPCTFMDRECVDATNYRVCIRTLNGTTWSGESTCASGVCVGAGVCCESDCVEGEKVCTNEGIQTCIKSPQGCLYFDAPQACPDNKSCTPDGQCVDQCQDSCTPNTTACVMEGSPFYKACLKGANGCFQLDSTDRQCPAGEVCQQGVCKPPTCQHQCGMSELGNKRCSGTDEEQCNADGQGCRRWEKTGQQCNINQCPCLSGMTADGKPIDNVCFYVPSEQQANCPMIAPGGYCDPNGDGSFADGDWSRGWHEYRSICGL